LSDLKAAALLHAGAGLRVFPCLKTKAPATPNGFHDATTNPETIKGWTWDGMIGACPPPGTIVIDVDPRNGGDRTMALLRENGKNLSPTWTVQTGGGGQHYYLTVPADARLRGKLGPGVDVKLPGKGYVIVPPSRGYTVLSPEPQAEAPDWLLAELKVEAVDVEGGEAGEPKYFPYEEGTPYGLAALEREMGRLLAAPEGERNNALNRAAFNMAQIAAGGEISRKRAINDLATVAPRIGLSVEEARGTIESGWTAGLRVPRQARLKVEALNVETFGRREDEAVAITEDDDPEAEGRYWLDWNVEEPEPPYLCFPVLPADAYVLVYGATEAAKSMAWLGLLSQGSHAGHRASIYSLENPPQTDRSRLRRWRPDPANLRVTNQPIDFNDARQVGRLVEREKEWGADVIMIDTYSHAFNSRSEDGNAKAVEFARRVRHVMREVGCSVVVLDHTGFVGDEPRDASAKRQQVDVAILMEKRGEWRAGEPARFAMTNRKAARFGNPFRYNGEIRDTQGDIHGLALYWEGKPPTWVER
jgi:Bifunctional DNA primase/polymerase, N-terminal/AAA domain